MAKAIGSLYKRTDMDTARIDEFVSFLRDFDRVEQSIIRKHPISARLNDKYKAFEHCIYELCVEHGESITILLLVYRDKLNNSLTALNIRLDFYLRFDGEKTTEYFNVLRFLRMSYKICSQAIGCINKILVLYGKKECNDTMVIEHCPPVGTQNLNNEITTIIDDVHYTTSFSDKTLKKVFDYLINRGCLHHETLLSDFIYFFTGRGAKNNDCLKWTSKKGGKVKLAYFINTIIKGGRDQDKSYWKKAEIIFGVKGLANSYSMSYSNNDNTSNEQFVEDIEKLLK